MEKLIRLNDAIRIARNANKTRKYTGETRESIYEVRQKIEKELNKLPDENKKIRFTAFEVVEILRDYGYNCGKFGWGETIKLTPSEVGQVLVDAAKDKQC